jgi:tetratricopeptide (TPR) repeat protein
VLFVGAGYLALVRGEYAQAIGWLYDGIPTRPQIARLFLGQALYHAGQRSQAAEVWRQADAIPYLQRLADYQRIRGLVAEAAVTREQVALIAPDSVQAWNDLGAIYINLQDWDASLAAYRRALQVAPGDVEANLGAARVLFAGYQNTSDARRHVQDALAALASQPEPDEVRLGNAYTLMGRLAAYEGRFDEAVRWYLETMRLPGYPKAENSLEIARMYQVLGDSEAMAHWIARAVAEAPDVAWIWCGAGDLYRVERNYPPAIQMYQRAVDLSPANVRYRLLLADTLRKSGNAGQAAAAYRQVLALDPTNQAAIEGLRRLGVEP